ncbi:MAG: exodeoxyribonuclease III [Planctomycetota bacterium]|nr:MAG: exodeoxyribonuclease III [Planctomycetota bacterium]
MKIATWNINSVRSRLDRLIAWLGEHKPDVLCLQELKCQEHQFPFEDIARAGYHAVMIGQKSYNGVAILSRAEPGDIKPATDLAAPLDSDDQARLISASVDGVRIICVYVPNGSDMTSDGYSYKLAWLDALGDMLRQEYSPEESLVICGDTNIIARDCDAANPQPWRATGMGCQAVRNKFDELCRWGLVDVFGQKHPEGGLFSWWDYRQLGFAKNRGLRIDHILTTRTLAKKCTDAYIDRDQRKGHKPSDHAPVIAIFE